MCVLYMYSTLIRCKINTNIIVYCNIFNTGNLILTATACNACMAIIISKCSYKFSAVDSSGKTYEYTFSPCGVKVDCGNTSKPVVVS